jgi:hypothetical protein
VQVKKWERSETRFAQTHSFLIHFLPSTNGCATVGVRQKQRQKQHQKQHQKQNNPARFEQLGA